MSDPALQTDDVEQHAASGSLALEDRPERDADAVIASAIELVDEALGRMLQRELVSSNEVTDVLLDLRSVLISG